MTIIRPSHLLLVFCSSCSSPAAQKDDKAAPTQDLYWLHQGQQKAIGATSGRWQVIADPSGDWVLAQVGKGGGFNIALMDGADYTDVDARVRLRAMAGDIDQGGGIVWRARDKKNYYVARYNPLEDNFRIYTVKDGHRRELKSATLHVDHRGWHKMRVTMRGTHIECFLDDVSYLLLDDDTFQTAGRVGLWTKADAQTQFRELAVTTP